MLLYSFPFQHYFKEQFFCHFFLPFSAKAMLDIKIIAASSVHNTIGTCSPSVSLYLPHIISESGMSLTNQNPQKNVLNVIYKRNWRKERYILWHDVVNNSVSQHPHQNTRPLNEQQFVSALQDLLSFNVVAFCYLPRHDNHFDLFNSLSRMQGTMPFIKMRNLLSKQYRKKLLATDVHLPADLEVHLVKRVLEASDLTQLILYRTIRRKRSYEKVSQ